MRKRDGFTLIELLVVIVILGLLAAIIVPKLTNRIGEAKYKTTEIQMKNIEGALKQYYIDTGMYPTTEQGLKALVEKPTIPPIPENWKQELDKVPTDGWGHPFLYVSPDPDGEHPFDLKSAGPDGKFGTKDDIDIWKMKLKD